MNTYYENLKEFTKMHLEITIEFSKITEPKVDCDLAKLLVNRIQLLVNRKNQSYFCLLAINRNKNSKHFHFNFLKMKYCSMQNTGHLKMSATF